MSKVDDRARALRTGRLPVAPEKLTLRRVERALGEPAPEWEGRCFEIASRIVAAGLVRGVAVYGHWIGPVHERSIFHRGGAVPFVQHGWIALEPELGTARVLDPTRWAFEAAEPYLFLGEPAGLYDEGGNAWRKTTRSPTPAFDASQRCFEVTDRILSSEAWSFVERYLDLRYDILDEGDEQRPGVLCQRQLAYLANAPLDDLGEHAEAVYAALAALDLSAFVPFDNRRRVAEGRWIPAKRA